MTGEHTVRVSNVSLQATEHDIRDFFSFSGEIVHVELQRDADWSQVAFVTFQNADALDTALLLSGATIVDQSVTIIPMEGYVLPTVREDDDVLEGESYDNPAQENKATGAITDVLSRGMLIGKTAATQVRQFDEKHGLSATAVATAATVDQKLGISEKFSAGTSAINQQLKGFDDRYQVSGKTKSALAVAEEKINVAGSAVMKNRYVLTGASWVTGAFSKVAKSAGEVAQKAKERATGGSYPEYTGEPYGGGGYARVNVAEPAAISLNSAATSRGYEYETHQYPYSGHSEVEATKPPPADGLIL